MDQHCFQGIFLSIPGIIVLRNISASFTYTGPRILHSKRLENLFREKIHIFLSRKAFYDHFRKGKAVIAVNAHSSGVMLQISFLESIQEKHVEIPARIFTEQEGCTR